MDPVFIETSDMSVRDTEIKKEAITEEDPLSDTNLKSMNTLQSKEASETVMKNEIEPELMMLKEEPEDEDCDLVTKIEIVDDMLRLTEPKNSDLQKFL